jgi:hypothetical protein
MDGAPFWRGTGIYHSMSPAPVLGFSLPFEVYIGCATVNAEALRVRTPSFTADEVTAERA